MTRKTYNAVATKIHNSNAEAATNQNMAVAIKVQESNLRLTRALADVFEGDNPRFDQARFMLACGFAVDSAKVAA